MIKILSLCWSILYSNVLKKEIYVFKEAFPQHFDIFMNEEMRGFFIAAAGTGLLASAATVFFAKRRLDSVKEYFDNNFDFVNKQMHEWRNNPRSFIAYEDHEKIERLQTTIDELRNEMRASLEESKRIHRADVIRLEKENSEYLKTLENWERQFNQSFDLLKRMIRKIPGYPSTNSFPKENDSSDQF
jgi:hypothetical protein